MSRFLSARMAALEPYVPGEQPRDRQYVKLNTNESPFPPAPGVIAAVRGAEAQRLNLYPDPTCRELRRALAARFGVGEENVLVSNGSDDILNFAFQAFCGPDKPVVFPAVSYGFYPVLAGLYGLPHTAVPLREDLSIDAADYIGRGENVVLANPNAPTGLALGMDQIERIAASNPDNLVLVDEAYVDFGAESCVPLTKRYENLLVVQTFSKSRSMAGARLGFAIGSAALIADLEAVKYSTNPYSLDRVTLAAGTAALTDESEAYHAANCRTIQENRAYTTEELTRRGFVVVPSLANFVFARRPGADGAWLYEALRGQGVLVRHFDKPGIRDYLRITIGSKEEMDALLAALDRILNKKGE